MEDTSEQKIREEAYHLYKRRQILQQAGTPESDWERAKLRIRQMTFYNN